jgi:hypothetical protein
VGGVDGPVGIGHGLLGLADGPALPFSLGPGALGPLLVGPLLSGQFPAACVLTGPLLTGPLLAGSSLTGPAGRAVGRGRRGDALVLVFVLVILAAAERAETETARLHGLGQLRAAYLGGHPGVGHGRAQGAGHLLDQRVRRVGDTCAAQGLPGQLGQQFPAALGQLAEAATVQGFLGRPQLIAETAQPVHRTGIGPGQLVHHPGAPGGPAQRPDRPRTRLVPGRAGLRHQVGAPVGELGRVGGVKLIGGRLHRVAVGHNHIVPRPRRVMIAPVS